MSMTDMVLSPLVGVVTSTLASALIEKGRMIYQVGNDIDTLSYTLSRIQVLLADAQERQITKRSVKQWLSELKDVAYDADDVLDEIAYEALRQEVEGGSIKGKRKQVRSFFPSCSCFGLKQVPFKLDIADKIKDINERIEKIHEDRKNLSLTVDDGRMASEPGHQRPLTTSLLTESELEIIGRNKDREEIMKLLLSKDTSGVKQVSLISIVGMGGLGKTTLAQLVYNNQYVKNYFEIRAWVCVSEDFDVSRLTKQIIESATRKSPCSSALDPMQRDLEEILRGKRFLIVLDDVWNTERSAWERLRAPFNVGARGSKIIVTTRADAVSDVMFADHPYHLNALGDEDCLSLFLRHAFVGENFDAINPELMKIGKELMERRGQGLPLAAKALGGLLSSKRDLNYWRSILNSQLWSSMEDQSEVMKALRVSYHHLPPHIKQCFAFCSIFPKDHQFEKDTLVKLWVAQGFIQPIPSITLSALEEEIGNEYFEFLLSRSFLQLGSPRYENPSHLYKMHDCIHDLAMLVSSDECFIFEHGKPTLSPKKGHRHLSFILEKDTKIEDFCHLYKGLRTFILKNIYGLIGCDMNQVFSDLIVNSRCLRALVFNYSGMTELRGSISNLKHLRYLDLSFTNIKELPESVSSLYNLQTLNLYNCYNLCQLPKETRKFVKLRHFNLDGCLSLQSMPPEMGRLSCLQTLPRFIVGRETGCGIGELKGLTALKGGITIEKLHNVLNAKEAEEANLKDKQNIQKLELMWDYDEEDAANANLLQDQGSLEELGKILEALQPYTNIKSLSLKTYGGKNFPSWLQKMMLPNLELFDIGPCTNCNSIPPLGQFRMLKNLKIVGIPGVKCIGHEFYGGGEIKGFPSLDLLRIENMPNLEEWCEPAEGEFPSLQALVVCVCPKLTRMPTYFSTLNLLELFRCHQLACLPKSPTLDKLYLRDNDEILLRSVSHFTSLSILSIEDFKGLKSLPEDMLQPLGNLKQLEIKSCEKLVSLMEEDKGLPPILRTLNIFSCPNIKSLPKGLQRLTSLKDLNIRECPQLLSLPEEGLPTSLQYLNISACDNLGDRCQKGDGEDWAKISHIPHIFIDGKPIS